VILGLILGRGLWRLAPGYEYPGLRDLSSTSGVVASLGEVSLLFFLTCRYCSSRCIRLLPRGFAKPACCLWGFAKPGFRSNSFWVWLHFVLSVMCCFWICRSIVFATASFTILGSPAPYFRCKWRRRLPSMPWYA
jgi:hypothetical protein